MRKLLTIILVIFSISCFAQEIEKESLIARNYPLLSTDREIQLKVYADTTSYESEYFAVYLNIQTSDIKPSQVEFAKKIVKFVKQNHGVVYINVQSGIPPCVPTPTRPCPKE